jgi:hypothetical protein
MTKVPFQCGEPLQVRHTFSARARCEKFWEAFAVLCDAGCLVILGPYITDNGMALLAAAEDRKVPLISTNGAKAFKDMGNFKSAKLFSAKASVAKKTYEQKLLGAHLAKQKMEKIGAKMAKPATPVKGLAPVGEELSGPSSATLAKNHSILSGKTKGVA